MWVSITTRADLPNAYAKINLIVAAFDCFMFWLWGNSFQSLIAWFVFGLEAIRLAIAYILFIGVNQRSVWKLKIFCIVEFVLLVLKTVVLIITWDVIGRLIYTGIIVGLRLFGIRIIGRFIAKLQIDMGEDVTFPWSYLQGPKQVDTVSTCYKPNDPSAPMESSVFVE